MTSPAAVAFSEAWLLISDKKAPLRRKLEAADDVARRVCGARSGGLQVMQQHEKRTDGDNKPEHERVRVHCAQKLAEWCISMALTAPVGTTARKRDVEPPGAKQARSGGGRRDSSGRDAAEQTYYALPELLSLFAALFDCSPPDFGAPVVPRALLSISRALQPVDAALSRGQSSSADASIGPLITACARALESCSLARCPLDEALQAVTAAVSLARASLSGRLPSGALPAVGRVCVAAIACARSAVSAATNRKRVVAAVLSPAPLSHLVWCAFASGNDPFLGTSRDAATALLREALGARASLEPLGKPCSVALSAVSGAWREWTGQGEGTQEKGKKSKAAHPHIAEGLTKVMETEAAQGWHTGGAACGRFAAMLVEMVAAERMDLASAPGELPLPFAVFATAAACFAAPLVQCSAPITPDARPPLSETDPAAPPAPEGPFAALRSAAGAVLPSARSPVDPSGPSNEHVGSRVTGTKSGGDGGAKASGGRKRRRWASDGAETGMTVGGGDPGVLACAASALAEVVGSLVDSGAFEPADASGAAQIAFLRDVESLAEHLVDEAVRDVGSGRGGVAREGGGEGGGASGAQGALLMGVAVCQLGQLGLSVPLVGKLAQIALSGKVPENQVEVALERLVKACTDLRELPAAIRALANATAVSSPFDAGCSCPHVALARLLREGSPLGRAVREGVKTSPEGQTAALARAAAESVEGASGGTATCAGRFALLATVFSALRPDVPSAAALADAARAAAAGVLGSAAAGVVKTAAENGDGRGRVKRSREGGSSDWAALSAYIAAARLHDECARMQPEVAPLPGWAAQGEDDDAADSDSVLAPAGAPSPPEGWRAAIARAARAEGLGAEARARLLEMACAQLDVIGDRWVLSKASLGPESVGHREKALAEDAKMLIEAIGEGSRSGIRELWGPGGAAEGTTLLARVLRAAGGRVALWGGRVGSSEAFLELVGSWAGIAAECAGAEGGAGERGRDCAEALQDVMRAAADAGPDTAIAALARTASALREGASGSAVGAVVLGRLVAHASTRVGAAGLASRSGDGAVWDAVCAVFALAGSGAQAGEMADGERTGGSVMPALILLEGGAELLSAACSGARGGDGEVRGAREARRVLETVMSAAGAVVREGLRAWEYRSGEVAARAMGAVSLSWRAVGGVAGGGTWGIAERGGASWGRHWAAELGDSASVPESLCRLAALAGAAWGAPAGSEWEAAAKAMRKACKRVTETAHGDGTAAVLARAAGRDAVAAFASRAGLFVAGEKGARGHSIEDAWDDALGRGMQRLEEGEGRDGAGAVGGSKDVGSRGRRGEASGSGGGRGTMLGGGGDAVRRALVASSGRLLGAHLARRGEVEDDEFASVLAGLVTAFARAPGAPDAGSCTRVNLGSTGEGALEATAVMSGCIKDSARRSILGAWQSLLANATDRQIQGAARSLSQGLFPAPPFPTALPHARGKHAAATLLLVLALSPDPSVAGPFARQTREVAAGAHAALAPIAGAEGEEEAGEWGHATACVALRLAEAVCAREHLRIAPSTLAAITRAPALRFSGRAAPQGPGVSSGTAAPSISGVSRASPAAVADWAVRAICESREGSAAAALVSSILRHRSGDGGRVHPHAVASICASLARIGALSRSVIPDRAWAAAPLPEAAGCSSGMDETDEASKADEARAAIGEWADDICATMEELARDKSVGAKYAPAVLAAYIEEIASPGAGARTPMRVLRMLRLGALALYGACKSKELQQVYASFRGEEMDVKREALSTLRQVYEAEFKHSGRV